MAKKIEDTTIYGSDPTSDIGIAPPATRNVKASNKLVSWVLPIAVLGMVYALLALSLTEQLSHADIMQRCVLVDPRRARIWCVGNVEIGFAYFGVFGGMLYYYLGVYSRSRQHLLDLSLALAYLLSSFALDSFCVQTFQPFTALLVGDAIVMTFTLMVSRQIWFQRLLGIFVPIIFLTCGMGHLLEGLSYWKLTYTLNTPWTMVTADIGFAVLVNASRFPTFIRGEDVIAELATTRSRAEQLEREVEARTQSLRQSEARLEEAQRVAMVGSWEYDLDTGQIVWSQETFHLLRFDPAENEPGYETFLQRFHPDDQRPLDAAVHRAFERGVPYEKDLRVVFDDGTVRWMHVRGRPAQNDGSWIKRLVGTIQDVTERRRIQSQLTETSKMAALGRVAAGVAHEVNNPLAAISGAAQLLQMHADTLVQEDATTIREMSERATRVIRSLRAFSHQGVDGETESRYPADLNQIIRDTVQLLQYAATDATAVIEMHLDTSLPAFPLDTPGIERVLINLITNATQAMVRIDEWREPSHIISVSTQALGAGVEGTRGRTVRLTVQDNGPGIPESVLPRIFEPFFTTRDVGEGMGLGLAICHSIVVAHGGTISVTSEKGQGTTFTIDLPIPADPSQNAA